MFNKDISFGDVKILEVSLDAEDWLQKLVGKNAMGNACSVEFTWDDVNKISRASFKKGGSEQLSIAERFDAAETLIIDTICVSDSSCNAQIRIKKPLPSDSNLHSVEIDINKRTLKGTVDIGSPEVPQIAFDLVAELKAMSSTVQIAALNPQMNEIMALYAWRHLEYGSLRWQWVANAVGTCLADTFTPLVSAAYCAVSGVLCLYSVPE